jgi:NADH dehydrogenase FAD-containing subunit
VLNPVRDQSEIACLAVAAAAAADESGFLLINEYLQSSGGPPEVFAVGDCASSARHPRPKAGVYAVRQVRHACSLFTSRISTQQGAECAGC